MPWKDINVPMKQKASANSNARKSLSTCAFLNELHMSGKSINLLDIKTNKDPSHFPWDSLCKRWHNNYVGGLWSIGKCADY